MVEGARLESVYTGNRIEGSNPSLSATCLNQLVLHWAERADFPVVLEGYAGRAEHYIGPDLANIVLSGATFSEADDCVDLVNNL